MLGRFLNAVQLAGRHRPVAAVLAGTPGLQDTSHDSRASFWNRGLRLPVGLLPDAEAQAVPARPFLDANLEADDEAVIELARTAEDHPYFLQLYGAAAWDTTEKSGARGLLRDHIPEAIRATNASRRRYYGDRYDEFFKANALPLARDVALAFRNSKSVMANATINSLLARHSGNPAEMRSMLNAKGFIRRDTAKCGLVSGDGGFRIVIVSRWPAHAGARRHAGHRPRCPAPLPAISRSRPAIARPEP